MALRSCSMSKEFIACWFDVSKRSKTQIYLRYKKCLFLFTFEEAKEQRQHRSGVMKSYLRPTAASRNRSRPVLQDVTNRLNTRSNLNNRKLSERKLHNNNNDSNINSSGRILNEKTLQQENERAVKISHATSKLLHATHVYKDHTASNDNISINTDQDEDKTTDFAKLEDLPAVEPLLPMYNDHIRKQLNETFNTFRNNSKLANDTNLHFNSSMANPEFIDDDIADPNMVMEYHHEIFQHLQELELQYAPDPNYMSQQLQLSWSYRTELVDWLVKVHEKFQLLPETLFLTINIMDRFLSARVATLNRFQLVGITSLFIAAKYEEIYSPTLQDLIYVLNNEYERKDIIQAEKFMITTLNFEISWPGPMSFLRKLSKADDYNYSIRSLSKYFLENCIMDARLVASPPSWLASGAYFLSKIILLDDIWSESHIFYSGYTRDQLLPLIMVIIEICESGIEKRDAIFNKYSLEDSSQNYVKLFQDWLKMAS